MDRTVIVEKLAPIVKEVFDDPGLVITDEMSAENVASWTSLSFMKLLSRIEEEFNFKFKIFELIAIHNMGDIINGIIKHCE